MAIVRTVRELLETSLRKIGVYHPGESIQAEDMSTALIALQDMLAEWADGGLLVPSYVTESFNTVAGTAAYTVGESGSPTLNTVRPQLVLNAYIRDGDTDYAIEIITKQEYDGISDKDTSGRPEQLFINYSAPNAYFFLYPNPSSIYGFYFTSLKQLTEPTVLTANLLNTYGIPREYHNALVWNLALEITEEYGKPPTQLMVKRATETKGHVISLNAARRVKAARLDVPTETVMNSSFSVIDV